MTVGRVGRTDPAACISLPIQFKTHMQRYGGQGTLSTAWLQAPFVSAGEMQAIWPGRRCIDGELKGRWRVKLRREVRAGA